eukprot:Pgem_evm1s11763
MALNLARSRLFGAGLKTMRPTASATILNVRHKNTFPDYNDEWDQKWVDYFNNEKIRRAGVLRGLSDVFAHDVIPDKRIIEAAFRCCRRLNFFPPTVRVMEGIKDKTESEADYQTIINDLRPIIDELGLVTPE